MKPLKKSVLRIVVVALLVLTAVYAEAVKKNRVMDVSFSDLGISFNPKVQCREMVVSISSPGGKVYTRSLSNGGQGFVSLSRMMGGKVEDGVYSYEVIMTGPEVMDKRGTGSGFFRVKDGLVVVPDETPEQSPGISRPNQHFNEDVYITGSLGVGDDIVDLATMAFETILLRQNNNAILFDDTSTLEGFANNDWRIKANDTYNGGANYFAVLDETNGTTPFLIQADAPDNTLFLESSGDVGIGTATPAANLHIKDTGSAYFRLEHGTGSLLEMYAGSSYSYFGTRDNYALRFLTNSTYRMTIGNTGNVGIGLTSPSYKLHISGGAYCDGTNWMDASSREYKENIETLSEKDALDTLNKLEPVTFNYKNKKDDGNVGFIAEDVPDLVASKDRKGLSAMDVVAVLTKVVQRQQKQLDKQEKLIEELKEELKKKR